MRREERLDRGGFALLLLEELLEKRRQSFRIDARTQRVHHALRLRLGFVVLAVRCGERIGSYADPKSASNGVTDSRERT
jgi:hypothetical protein